MGLVRGMPFVARVASRVKADLLHSHFGNNGWANLHAAARARVPHVVTFYGHDVDQLPACHPEWNGRYAELFSAVDQVLCEGPFMARRIAARGCVSERVRVHHLGIDLARFDYRPRIKTKAEPLRVLIAASFREKKGIPDALAALGRLRQDLALEITIIGDAVQSTAAQAEKARIQETVLETGLSDRVRFLGFQSHERLKEEAYRHHIFIQASRQARDGDSEGGAPVALIEMAATGMPVVATTHCDIPEVVRHSETGFLAPEGDVEGLAEHIRWLATHPDEWRPLLDASRLHIEREFDAVRQGERLAQFYEQLLGRDKKTVVLPHAA